MAVDHVLVQRFKTKENLINTYKCYKASKFLYKNDLATSLFWHETNFERFSLKSVNIEGVFRDQSNISDEILSKDS